MTTATAAVPTLAGQSAYGHALDSKLSATSVKAAFATGVSRVRDGLSSLAAKANIGGVFTWLRVNVGPYLGWAVALVRHIGPNTILAYAMTTHEGRDTVLHRVPATVYKVAMYIPRFVGRQIAKVTNKCGRRAQIATAFVPMAVERAEDVVSEKTRSFDGWLADRHDSTWMSTTRSISYLMICTRVIQRFIPSGWLRLVAYSVIPFMPTTRTKSTEDGIEVTKTQTVLNTVTGVVLGRDDAEVVVHDHSALDSNEGTVTTLVPGSESEADVIPPASNGSQAGNREQRRQAQQMAASGGQGKRSQGPHGRTPNHHR